MKEIEVNTAVQYEPVNRDENQRHGKNDHKNIIVPKVMVLVREVAAPMIRSKTAPAAALAEPERLIQKIRE